MDYLFTKFAAEYNCGAYGAGAYDVGTCTTATDPGTATPATGAGNNGGLAYTGMDVLVPLMIGLAIMVAAVIFFIRNLRSKKNNAKI